MSRSLTIEQAIRSHQVAHDHLFDVLKVLVGKMADTETKLSKRLGHQGMQLIPHTKGGPSQRGFGVQWQAAPNDIAAWQALLEEEAQPGFDRERSPDAPPTQRRSLRPSAPPPGEPEDAA